MAITFRIDDGHHSPLPNPAIITADQLAALRDLLAEQAMRLGVVLLRPTYGVTGDAAFELEARVCPLALAVVSQCFDHDPAVIAVIEEAQFLGRRVRIWQTERAGDIMIGIAVNPDAAPVMSVNGFDALAILTGLGLDREQTGSIPMAELRQRLTDPRIRRRLDDNPRIAPFLETLNAMAALKAEDREYNFAWI